MWEKKCLIMMPHFDDEYLMAGSFLVNYPGEIHIIFTHVGDSISDAAYDQEESEFKQFTEELQKHREKYNLGKYSVAFYPKKGQVTRLGVTNELHKEICDRTEALLNESTWEYFIYSCESMHQNHQQCNVIASSFLRDPYLFNIKTVLMGTYPPDIMVTMQDTLKDCVYRPISEKEMDILNVLGHPYLVKLKKFPKKLLEKIYTFYGMKINKEFAQSFYPKNIILDD